MKRAAAEGLHEIHTANWPTSVKSIEAVGTPLARTISHGGESALYEEDGVLFEVHLWGSSFTVTAAGRKREDVTSGRRAPGEALSAAGSELVSRGAGHVLDVHAAGAPPVVAADRRARLGRDRVELRGANTKPAGRRS